VTDDACAYERPRRTTSFHDDESARNWGRKASLDGTLYARWLTLTLARERDFRFFASGVSLARNGAKTADTRCILSATFVNNGVTLTKKEEFYNLMHDCDLSESNQSSYMQFDEIIQSTCDRSIPHADIYNDKLS